MATDNICPFCGAPIDNPASTKCDSCGNALPARAASSETIISPRASFNSSAEVMDEAKKLAREGNSDAAAQVIASEFGQTPEDAKQAVDQIEVDMQHDGRESFFSAPAVSTPDSHPEVIDAPAFTPAQPPSNRRNWIIGGSIGAAVFLCCCCCLPMLSFISKLHR
jgi:hypothetical protein